MKKIHGFHFIFFILLWLPTLLYSQTILPTSPVQQVTDWTERTFMTTLTAGYHDDISEAANVRKHYIHAAWIPMEAYLRSKLIVTTKQENLFHPVAISPPVIIEREICDNGVSCWLVHQAFKIPEIRNKVDFTALVITADPAHQVPFLIKKLTIAVTEY